jgi:hypothetical protein
VADKFHIWHVTSQRSRLTTDESKCPLVAENKCDLGDLGIQWHGQWRMPGSWVPMGSKRQDVVASPIVEQIEVTSCSLNFFLILYSQHPRNATPQNATLVNPSLITTKFLNQNADLHIKSTPKLQLANQICVSTDWLHLGDVDCICINALAPSHLPESRLANNLIFPG